jgi:hypothetical protein
MYNLHAAVIHIEQFGLQHLGSPKSQFLGGSGRTITVILPLCGEGPSLACETPTQCGGCGVPTLCFFRCFVQAGAARQATVRCRGSGRIGNFRPQAVTVDARKPHAAANPRQRASAPQVSLRNTPPSGGRGREQSNE